MYFFMTFVFILYSELCKLVFRMYCLSLVFTNFDNSYGLLLGLESAFRELGVAPPGRALYFAASNLLLSNSGASIAMFETFFKYRIFN